MTAETDLVNAALRAISAKRITSLTDGSKEANVARDLFATVRDDLLASHNWNFASKSVRLARSATTPVLDFDYGYALPADWLRTVAVHDNDAGAGAIQYREELLNNQAVLLCGAEQVYLRYVARITDVNLWRAWFRRAFELAMARDMAIPLGNSDAIYERMEKRAARALLKARSADALGSPPEQRRAGSWVTARGGWRSPGNTTGWV